MLIAALIVYGLCAAALGAMAGWYSAVAVVRLREGYQRSHLDREAMDACRVIEGISRQAQSTLYGLAAEGLSRRR